MIKNINKILINVAAFVLIILSIVLAIGIKLSQPTTIVSNPFTQENLVMPEETPIVPNSPILSNDQIKANSFEEAKELAVQHDKKILFIFSTSWCGPCRQMKATTLVNAQVVAKLKDYILYSVDAEADRDTSVKYHVSAVPTIVIADKQGRELNRTSGPKSVPAMLQFLDN